MASDDEEETDDADTYRRGGRAPSRPVFNRVPVPSQHGPLMPASVWRGRQSSGRASYDVAIRFQHIDLEHTWTASGILRVEKLAPHLPVLTTEFDAEIIGPRHGFIRPAKQTGGFHEADVERWSRFDKFGEVEPTLRFEDVDDNRSTMTLDDALERPYLFMRLCERALGPDMSRSVRGIEASIDGTYYLCLAWHGEQASEDGKAFKTPPTSHVRQPMLRRASASSTTPFSWASVVAGRPTSPSPPASPKIDAAALPGVAEQTEGSGDSGGKVSVDRAACASASVIECTRALEISANDFPVAPLSPRIGRPSRRRASTSLTVTSPVRSVSRAVEMRRYTGLYADATLSGIYVPHDTTDPQKLSLTFAGCGPSHDPVPPRSSVCSSGSYTLL